MILKIKKLNDKLLDIISNYHPDLIVFGHADLIDNETIKFIKKIILILNCVSGFQIEWMVSG